MYPPVQLLHANKKEKINLKKERRLFSRNGVRKTEYPYTKV
jgi:hypothetical protein